jgi:sugar lactone lactonase YvrE
MLPASGVTSKVMTTSRGGGSLRGMSPRARSTGRALRLLAAALTALASCAAAPSAVGAAPAAGTIATVAGGPVLGPVAATSVGQSPQIVAASRAGTPYVYTLDGSNNNINRIDESSGQQVLFAGNGASGSSADGSVAAGAALLEPCGLAVDEAGNVYIEEAASRVRIVPASTGTLFGQAMSAGHIYTVAGTGVPGFAGDGGPASSAQFDARAFFAPPGQIAVDGEGDIAIADSFDNRVRFVPAKSATYYGRSMSAGDIYTLAGTGEAAFGGDGGAAGEAKLNEPLGVGFDSLNNLAIGDTQNARVRFVSASSKSQFGQSMTAGAIYTIAGNGKQEYAGEGVAATGGGLQFPDGVAFDALGDLLLAETNGARVRAVPRISGNLYGALRTAGDIYTIAGNGSFGFSGDGGIAGGAQISSADSVAIDHGANLLIADGGNNRVRLVPSSSGSLFGTFREPDHIYTVAGNGSAGFSGDGGPATASELASPVGVAVAPHGGFAVADFFNNRIRFVSAGEDLFGQAMSAEDMYTLAGNGTGAFGGDGGPGTSAELSEPEGVAFDAAGDLAIADRFNHRVRFLPATAGTYFGQAMSAAHIYTIAGSGKAGFGGDGGAGPAAELHEPTSVAFDAAGDLFIADSENQRVRFLPATSGIYFGQAMSAAHVYTIAGNGKAGFSGDGGPAGAAELQNVWSVAADAAGDVVLADPGNSRVRFVPAGSGSFYGQAMSAAHIYTIAGNGGTGFGGDGGPATAAELEPEGVALDAAGDVAIGDERNNRVRLLAAHEATMFGVAMRGGDLYTIAGSGATGFGGDGGAGAAALLAEPNGVAFDTSGDVLFADSGNNRVRIVYGGGPAGASGSQPSVPAQKGAGPKLSKAPLLGGVRQSHSRWREGSALARISRRHRAPLGTAFSFTLDQSATVTLRFTQRVAGRRQGRRCVAPSHRNAKRRRCARVVTVATLSFAAHAGLDKLAFQGRVSRTRKLRPGRYTMLIRATNVAGSSATRSLTFTVVR